MRELDVRTIARDLAAFGSIPFMVLVVARLFIGLNVATIFQVLFSILIVELVRLGLPLSRRASYLTIIAIVTSLFYGFLIYALFAGVLFFVALYLLHRFLEERYTFESGLIAATITGIAVLVSMLLGLENIPA